MTYIKYEATFISSNWNFSFNYKFEIQLSIQFIHDIIN